MGRNHSRIILLRVVKKTLARVVHLILVLLRVIVQQVLALGEIIILVVNLAINLLNISLNHLWDLVRV